MRAHIENAVLAGSLLMAAPVVIWMMGYPR